MIEAIKMEGEVLLREIASLLILYLANLIASNNLRIDGEEIEQVHEYNYLGREIRIGSDNQTCEIFRRI